MPCPVRLGQELGGWASQIAQGIERVEGALPRIAELTQGGTAVGTGINAHPEFAERIAAKLSEMTGLAVAAQPEFLRRPEHAGCGRRIEWPTQDGGGQPDEDVQ